MFAWPQTTGGRGSWSPWETVPGSRELEAVTVYERPAEFYGRAGGLVVVLNGPSSVGKSSMMREFADRAPTPFACLEELLVGRLATRYLAWPETVGPHVDGVLAALSVAGALGNQFIVSAAGIPQHRFRAVLEKTQTLYIGLHAPIEELVRRQRLQADKFGGLAEQSTGIHEGWDYDLWMNTTQHDPDAAAELLASLLGMELL